MKFLNPTTLMLIALVALIIFGPKRLPDIGKSMRRGMRAFKEEVEPADSEAGSKDGDSMENRPK